MSNSNSSAAGSRESTRGALNGWVMLAVNFGLIIGGTVLLLHQLRLSRGEEHSAVLLWGGILLQLIGLISLGGHFALQPNEARVLILAGAYHGTVRKSGFFWANPFYSRA